MAGYPQILSYAYSDISMDIILIQMIILGSNAGRSPSSVYFGQTNIVQSYIMSVDKRIIGMALLGSI